MKKITVLLALGAAVALMPSVSKATIVGSVHDFYANTNLWTAYGTTPYKMPSSGTNASVCRECHQIHHTPDPTKGPLWIHSSSAYASSGYTTYDKAGSESYDMMGLDAPSLGSSSIACLSCHDGTVGINQTTALNMDGTLGTQTTTSGTNGAMRLLDLPGVDKRVIAVNGNDLTHTHPIGINYVNAVAKVNAIYPGELIAPTTGVWPWTRLKGTGHTQLECSTCHDIHNTQTIPSGTYRCTQCHNK